VLPAPTPMLRYLIVDLLLPLLVFAILRSFLRSLFQTGRDVTRHAEDARQAPPPPSRPDVIVGGELKKDPVCGTYVSTGASVTRTVDGQLLHFCSKECRDKYRAA
jgi:YHS domain-containing protein